MAAATAPATTEFFSELFDWKMEDAGPATFVQTGSDVGGHITALGHEPHHYTIFYVKVDDVKAYLEKASPLGGKTLVPPGRDSNRDLRVVRRS